MKRVRMLQIASMVLCLSILLGPGVLAAFAQSPATPPRQTFPPPYAAPGGPAYGTYGEASTSTAAPQQATSPAPSGYAPHPTLQFHEEQRSQGGVIESPNPPTPGIGFSETGESSPPRPNPALTERTPAPESITVQPVPRSESAMLDAEVEPVVYDRTPIPSIATPTSAMSIPTSSTFPVIAQATEEPPQQNSRSTSLPESESKNIPLQPPSEENNDSENAFADGHPFLTMGASLLLVLGGFFVLAWFVRRMAPQAQRPLPREVVELLGRSPIGPRRQLQLIRFGGKLVLTSVSNDGVQPISEITDPEEVRNLTQQCRRKADADASNETQPGFRQFVDRFKHKTNQETTPRQTATSEGGPRHSAHATPAPHEPEQEDDDSAMSIDNLAGLFAETRHEGYAETTSRSVPLSDLRSM